MSTMPARPPRRSGALARLLASFWIADVLVLTLIAFFIVVGGSTSTPLLIVGCVLLALYAVHAVLRHQRDKGRVLSMEERQTRERRGF
jgi:hypothetical protein